MPSSQSDSILRMIELVGAAMRRLRERLARGVPAAEEVLEGAEQAQAELFGPLWPTLRTVDAWTAASLVPDARQLRLWTDLLRLEASAARLLEDDARADAMERRAVDLLRALESRESGARPE
jgi:hypothetical protein